MKAQHLLRCEDLLLNQKFQLPETLSQWGTAEIFVGGNAHMSGPDPIATVGPRVRSDAETKGPQQVWGLGGSVYTRVFLSLSNGYKRNPMWVGNVGPKEKLG